MAHIRRLLAVGVAKMTVNEARIAYVGQQLGVTPDTELTS